MKIFFSKDARKQFENWKQADNRVANKIDELLNDIKQNGFTTGKGKPEQLRYYKNPVRFSRRITQQDRLVYCQCNQNDLLIISCKGHYED